MAGIAFIVIFAIAVLPILRITGLPLRASEKLWWCLLATLISPPVVTVSFFFLSKHMAPDIKDMVGRSRYAEKDHVAAPRIILHAHLLIPRG